MFSSAMFEFPLYEATRAGQDDVVINLLKQGVNPSNYKDEHGNTALHIAVIENKPSLVAILLEHGADFLHENKDKQNPIALATDSARWDCILEFGKYNKKNPSSALAEELGNPLLTAVEMGKAGEEYVRELLKGKVELNSWSLIETDEYALHIAASANSAQLVQLLVEKGANILEKNKAGDMPALLAAKKGHWDCVNILMQHRKLPVSVDNPDDQFSEILLLAVAAGHTDLVHALLEQGVSPNYCNEAGNTALHIAIMDKNPKIIASLLAHNADPQKQNKEKTTPLHLLIASEHYWDGIAEFAKYNEKNPTPAISQAGCILLIDILKATPIREDRVVMLVKGNTDVNSAQDLDTKQTALHIAAANNLPHIVLALLKAGADREAIDANSDTAVTLAAKLGNWACVKVLVRFKNNTGKKLKNYFDSALLLAVKANQPDVVEDLLKAGANPNNALVVPASQNGPLHEAALLRNPHLLGLLLVFNANGSLKNADGHTAVDLTAKLQDWSTLATYPSPQYFSKDQAREILFVHLISEERQNQSCFFYTILPAEVRELIFQFAFSAFTSPNDFRKYLATMRDNLLLCSIKALHKHIAVHSQKRSGLFPFIPIKFPPEIKALSQQLQSVCEEISSSQTKIGTCKEIIADFTANYLFEPSWSSAGIDLLTQFHLVAPSYDKLTLYIRQVNSFRRAVAQTDRDSLPVVAEEPIVNILCQQLKAIYDHRGNSHPSTVEEQLKKRIKTFVDQYGHVKEAMNLLAQFELLPKQSLFKSLTFRSL